MPDYSRGKIYRLVCNTTGKQYIGSTTNELYKRKREHKDDYIKWGRGKKRYCSSYEIVKNENFDIVLVEKYACEDKQELHARERHWIEKTDCVNTYIPTRTGKEWYQDNKERLNKQHKVWVENNRKRYNAYMRDYNEAKTFLKNISRYYFD